MPLNPDTQRALAAIDRELFAINHGPVLAERARLIEEGLNAGLSLNEAFNAAVAVEKEAASEHLYAAADAMAVGS